MNEPADFLLTTCQVGAERALKAEFARRWPELRPAYARPGFVTFKARLGALHAAEYANSIFARAAVVSLGKVTSDDCPASEGSAGTEPAEETRAAYLPLTPTLSPEGRGGESPPALILSPERGRGEISAALAPAAAPSISESPTDSPLTPALSPEGRGSEMPHAPARSPEGRGSNVPLTAAMATTGGKAGAAEMAAKVWRLFGDRPATGLHVWHRDLRAPGDRGFEAGFVPEDAAIARAIRDARPGATLGTWVHPGQFVLDCIVVEPHEWWVGCHQATLPHTCWPGGFCGVALPPYAVSRAYQKMEEALRWSQLPIQPGQRCVELGSAPGGAAQALLDRGLTVIGIDPAEMHPAVLANPNFTHVRKRGDDVRRRDFRKVRWLFSDMNVAPQTMLDTVEGIVTYPESNVRGLILTLKLLDWQMAEHIPEHLFRIRTWGYKEIHVRQLQHNRQEICVAALRG